MQKLILSILILTSFGLCVFAQKSSNPKPPPLPNNLVKYVDEYPEKLMKVPAVKTRLKLLLGKNYSTFDSNLTVQAPMKEVGDFLFASGCLPHSCTISEAAFVIDLKNKRIHAVIYEKDVKPKFYNEDKAATPEILLNWVNKLKQM
jgi:hypothetical protein